MCLLLLRNGWMRLLVGCCLGLRRSFLAVSESWTTDVSACAG